VREVASRSTSKTVESAPSHLIPGPRREEEFLSQIARLHIPPVEVPVQQTQLNADPLHSLTSIVTNFLSDPCATLEIH
jgi:hypothetical protein